MTKEELRRIELMAMPPIKKGKEPSTKEKLHFWWADVKLFFRRFIPNFVCCMLLVFAYLILLKLTVQIVRHQP